MSKITSKRDTFLSIALVVFSFSFIFLPFQSYEHTYQWNPAVDGNKVRLSLLELNPESFEINFPCLTEINSRQWIFEAKGGPAFLVEADKNYFYFTTGAARSDTLVLNQIPRLIKKLSCESKIIYDSKRGALEISNSEETKIHKLAEGTLFYFSSYTQWNPDVKPEDFKLVIKTKSLVDAQKNYIKIINCAILIFLLLISFKDKIQDLIRHRKNVKFGLDHFDKFSILVLLFAAVFVAPMADDGLYLIAAKVLNETNILMQYQYPVTFPTGQIHAVMNSLSAHFSLGFFYHRIIPGLILFAIWKIINSILKIFIYINQGYKVLFFSLWMLFVFSFGMTLRPEPYVVLIFFGFILLLLKYSNSTLRIPLYYSVVASSLSLALHQSGFVIVASSISFWIYLLVSRKVLILNLKFVFNLFSLSTLIFFLNSSLILYFKRYSNFGRVNEWPQPFVGEFKWGYPPYLEYMRLIHVKYATPSQVLIILLIFLTLLLLLVFSQTILRKFSDSRLNMLLVYSAIVSAPIGLILAPSKWSGHYAALFPVLILGLVILIESISSKFFLFSSIIFVGSLSYLWPWQNGGSSTSNFDKNFRNSLFPKILELQNILAYGLPFLLIILLLLRLKNNELGLKLVRSLSLFVILLSPMLQIAPNVIDSFYPSRGWTFPRQVINSLNFSRSDCGFYDIDELHNSGIDVNKDSFIFATETYAHFECLKPTLPVNGIWQYPNFSVGGIPVWDQQRLAYESKIEKVYCPYYRNRSFNDEIYRCIYKWTSNILNMKLINSRKIWVY